MGLLLKLTIVLEFCFGCKFCWKVWSMVLLKFLHHQLIFFGGFYQSPQCFWFWCLFRHLSSWVLDIKWWVHSPLTFFHCKHLDLSLQSSLYFLLFLKRILQSWPGLFFHPLCCLKIMFQEYNWCYTKSRLVRKSRHLKLDF